MDDSGWTVHWDAHPFPPSLCVSSWMRWSGPRWKGTSGRWTTSGRSTAEEDSALWTTCRRCAPSATDLYVSSLHITAPTPAATATSTATSTATGLKGAKAIYPTFKVHSARTSPLPTFRSHHSCWGSCAMAVMWYTVKHIDQKLQRPSQSYILSIITSHHVVVWHIDILHL